MPPRKTERSIAEDNVDGVHVRTRNVDESAKGPRSVPTFAAAMTLGVLWLVPGTVIGSDGGKRGRACFDGSEGARKLSSEGTEVGCSKIESVLQHAERKASALAMVEICCACWDDDRNAINAFRNEKSPIRATEGVRRKDEQRQDMEVVAAP
jgi:hypothetical protein